MIAQLVKRPAQIIRTVALLGLDDREIRVRDHATGREAILPLAHVEITPVGEGFEGWSLTLPEWLAIERGMI
ncbi:MAG: hypothetical protein Kow0032_07560 [Methyloligellaceae bacterium]